jgi:hypothetical protein
MFDITKRGAVCEAHADAALHTMLGPCAAPPHERQAQLSHDLSEDRFIALMQGALIDATPLCRGMAPAPGTSRE